MNLEDQRRHIVSGAMYDDRTPELVHARERAVLATDRHNASFGQPPRERAALLREALGHAGDNADFEPTSRCEFGFDIGVGNNFYANFDCVMLDGGGITISDDVLTG